MALKPTIKAVFPPVVLGNTENTVIIIATKEKIIWRMKQNAFMQNKTIYFYSTKNS